MIFDVASTKCQLTVVIILLLTCRVFVYVKNEIMASASSSSARSLFADSKLRLADRVQVNVNNIASLTRQIQRGSKSNEVSLIIINTSFY